MQRPWGRTPPGLLGEGWEEALWLEQRKEGREREKGERGRREGGEVKRAGWSGEEDLGFYPKGGWEPWKAMVRGGK